MSKRKFLVDIDLNYNQLLKGVLEKSSAAVGTPAEGQIYYNTTDYTAYLYAPSNPDSASGWLDLGLPSGSLGTDLTWVAGTSTIESSTGNNAIISLADGTNAGLLASADYTFIQSLDVDLGTFALPANTTISVFGASLIDDADASAARTTLDVDQAGTDNSTNVTLTNSPGTYNYLTISGQAITLGQIDLTTDVTGVLPIANFATIDDDTFATASNTTVPTSESTKAYVDSSVTGALVYQGGYDASTDTPSLDDGTPIAGIKQGWTYTVTVGGNFFTEAVEAGDMLIAEVDSPTTLADWTVVNKNIPEIVTGNLTEATSSVLTILGGTDAVIGTGTSIEIAQANGSTNGYLSSTDWTTFNNKSNTVGTVTSVGMSVPTGFEIGGSPITSSGTLALTMTAGYSIPTDTNQTNWTSAYNNMITSASFNTTDGVITLNQQDAGTVTVDIDGRYALSSSIGDGTLTVNGTGVLGGTGTFTANQSGASTIDITHDNVVRSDTTSNQSPAHGATFTAVDSVSSTAQGHITAINVKTVTLPSIPTSVTNKYVATIGNGALTSIPVTHSLSEQYVTAQVFDAVSNEQVECEVVLTSDSVTTFNFNVAPTTNEFRVVIIG